MSTGRLIFSFPAPLSREAVQRLLSALTAAGFIGKPLRPGAPEFLAGDRFLQLVTFMGCSPFLQLEPDDVGDGEFCHVRVRGPYREPRFIRGTNTRPPRCPGCRRRVEAWQPLAERWEETRDAEHRCPECGTETPFADLEWRQNAGVGRLFIEVTQVFPGEAVPVPALMDLLAEAGGPWSYFYVQG